MVRILPVGSSDRLQAGRYAAWPALTAASAYRGMAGVYGSTFRDLRARRASGRRTFAMIPPPLRESALLRGAVAGGVENRTVTASAAATIRVRRSAAITIRVRTR